MRKFLNREGDLHPLPDPWASGLQASANGYRERGDLSEIDLVPVEVEDDKAVLLREAACLKVRTAPGPPRGERNTTLNREAFQLGSLLRSGRLDFELTWWALHHAARANGSDDEREIHATLKSGLLSGITAQPLAGPAPADQVGFGDTATILDAVVAFQKRFIVFVHDSQADALALWAVHTHCVEAADCTPYVWVASPAPTSGKTRLAEVLELIVHTPLRVSNTSTAAIFRAIPRWRPTLLLDELDTKFKGDDKAEDLRGLINAGFNRGAYVLRVAGKDLVPTKFDVFCPKMLTGINTGAFPDTVAKRSIPIRLHRKLRSEKVDRFRARRVKAEADRIQSSLAAWAEAHTDALTAANPVLPEELSDRQQDAWEPLLAIADMAGAPWAKRARDAAKRLHGAAEEETTEGVLLLEHIRDAFDELKTDRLLTGVLLTELIKREEGPWAIWWEHAISNDNIKGPGSKLAGMLKAFGIHPKSLRLSTGVGKGYERVDFEGMFARYFENEEGAGP